MRSFGDLSWLGLHLFQDNCETVKLSQCLHGDGGGGMLKMERNFCSDDGKDIADCDKLRAASMASNLKHHHPRHMLYFISHIFDQKEFL